MAEEEEKKNKTHTKTAPEFAVKKTFLCEEIGNVTFSQLLSKIIFDHKNLIYYNSFGSLEY